MADRWDDDTIDWYVEAHGEDPTTRAVVEAAPVADGQDVLDVGCGSGASLRHLARRGGMGRLVGVDPFTRMIGHAERLSLGTGIVFAVAPAEALPFADGSFDGVLCVNAVHHWAELRAGLAEAARVLRPGGWLTIGGEVFGQGWLPGGQDYRSVLQAVGLEPRAPDDIEGGYVIVARRGNADV